MCGGGGGGDGGAAEARAAEDARQKKIQQNINRINNYYDGLTDPKAYAVGQANEQVASLEALLSTARAGERQLIPEENQSQYSTIPGFNAAPRSPLYHGDPGRYETIVDEGRVNEIMSQLSNARKGVTAAENGTYGDPTKEIYDANFNLYKKDLLDNYQEAALDDKFSLARRGLTSGSADYDQRSKRRTELNKGTVRAEQLSDNARLDYLSGLNNERSNLIAQAQGGLSGTDAIRLAAQNQQNAANSAKNAAVASNLGSVFSSAAAGYTAGQQAQGRNDYYNGAYFAPKSFNGRVS